MSIAEAFERGEHRRREEGDIVEIYAALRRDHPARPLPRDLEEWMILEVVRLREEVQAERAAVVAWLREQQESVGLPLTAAGYEHAADAIERGEHRREEKP